MTRTPALGRDATLLRRGQLLEVGTLAWNVVGIFVLAFAAVAAHSVALAGFGLESLIEIGASAVVLWELSGIGEARQRRALDSSVVRSSPSPSICSSSRRGRLRGGLTRTAVRSASLGLR
jgi:hypothetical protein